MSGNATRINNSQRNMIYGMICQVCVILFSFINRQIFISLLGEEYLGINGLFSNILTLLSLTEMGLGNAFLFYLYKPIQGQDYVKVRALLIFCKRLFRYVAIGVFGLGIMIFPLMPLIVDTDIQIDQVRIYFFFYLMSSVLSYFSVNKSMVIEACQKSYVTNLYKTISQILQNICQMILLLFFHDYLMYLLVQIICTILYNIAISFKAYRMYPYFFDKKENLDQKNKKEILKMVRSTFVYRAGVIMMNSTDNILISIIISTVTVGFYSNYKMIETVVSQFISVIIKAITASIGDLNAENDSVHSLKIFKVLVFTFHVLIAFCSICLLLCLNDFILLWIGEKYLLDIGVIVAMVFCFYISNIINPVWVYRETMGLYQETKYLMLIAAFINLILSIILGRLISLSGIIVATGLARVLTTVWYEPRILFKKRLRENVRVYYFQQIRYIVQSLICVLISYYLSQYISHSFLGMVGKVMVTFIVVSIVFVLFNRKTPEYEHLKEIMKVIIKRYK